LLDLCQYDVAVLDTDVEKITDVNLQYAAQLGRDDDPSERIDATSHTNGVHANSPHKSRTAPG
jgi:hypothetical protein